MSNINELFNEMFHPERIEPKGVQKPSSIQLLNPEVEKPSINNDLVESDTITPSDKENLSESKSTTEISRFSREFEMNASEDTLKELWLQGKRKNIMSEERFLKEMQGLL